MIVFFIILTLSKALFLYDLAFELLAIKDQKIAKTRGKVDIRLQ